MAQQDQMNGQALGAGAASSVEAQTRPEMTHQLK